MKSAFIKYNPKTLKINEIIWEKPDKNFIEISYELACEFLSGEKSIHNFCISKINSDTFDIISTSVLSNTITPADNFIDLSKSKYQYTISNEGIKLYFDKDFNQTFYMACTLFNQPSNLLKLWKMSPIGINKYLYISYNNAKQYSWFLIFNEIT